MRNDDDRQEHTGAPPVPRCGYCGEPLLQQRRGAKFCSREHKELARQRRKRASDLLTTLRGRHPLPDPPDLREHTDYYDVGIYEQQDEQGIHGGDSAPAPHEADIRFAAMIDKGHARGGPSQSTRKVWRQYGKRHGTEHPEQTADRVARH